MNPRFYAPRNRRIDWELMAIRAAAAFALIIWAVQL